MRLISIVSLTLPGGNDIVTLSASKSSPLIAVPERVARALKNHTTSDHFKIGKPFYMTKLDRSDS